MSKQTEITTKNTKLIENHFFRSADASKIKKSTFTIEMRSKPLEGSQPFDLKAEGKKGVKKEKSKLDTVIKCIPSSVGKSVEKKEKCQRSRRNESANFCVREFKTKKDLRHQAENNSEKFKKKKFETKYPIYYTEKENYQAENKYQKHVTKPANIYKPVDEFFFENERLEKNFNKIQKKIGPQTDATVKYIKTQKTALKTNEVGDDFHGFYQNQSALIEAQNYLIHEHKKFLQAKQLAAQLRYASKVQKLTAQAQVLEIKCQELKKRKEKAVRDIIKASKIDQLAFQQYVTTL